VASVHAVQLVKANSPLIDSDVDRPSPGRGEVAISIEAAGICRSDLHYRSGFPRLGHLPRTLGHEVAGTITAVGPDAGLDVGARVCVHYLVTCGNCDHCTGGFEQFCAEGRMIGKELDGGFAESIVVPASNAFPIPEQVSTAAAAIMMCSTATVFHALAVGRVTTTDSVVIFGAGGLGQSAVQLGRRLAGRVIAVDPNPVKRALAASFDAIAVDPGDDAVGAVRAELPEGADVVVDLVGSAEVMRAALDVLAPMGRAVAVGLTSDVFEIGPYTDLVIGEHQVLGSSDHLATEIPQLLDLAADRAIDLDGVISRSVPLEAAAINDSLDRMADWGDEVRIVVER